MKIGLSGRPGYSPPVYDGKQKSEKSPRSAAVGFMATVADMYSSTHAVEFSMKDYFEFKQNFPTLSADFDELKGMVKSFEKINLDNQSAWDEEMLLNLMNRFADAGALEAGDVENMQTCVEHPDLINAIRPAASSTNVIERISNRLEFEKRQKQAVEGVLGEKLPTHMQEHLNSLLRVEGLLGMLKTYR